MVPDVGGEVVIDEVGVEMAGPEMGVQEHLLQECLVRGETQNNRLPESLDHLVERLPRHREREVDEQHARHDTRAHEEDG
jgi:hypothetical protein